MSHILGWKKNSNYDMTKLTNLIESEPTANHVGNKPLSAIRVIHGAEHTCGEGKHIAAVKKNLK